MKKRRYIYMLAFFSLIGAACKKPASSAFTPDSDYAYEEGEEYSAGNTTINDASPLAFSYQVPGLNQQDGLDFFVGNSFFSQNWVQAPSTTTARDGLGPMFNARSCASCHFKDGRGAPLANNGLLFRLSIPGVSPHGDPLPDPLYGGQLQDNSIQDVNNEGNFSISYTEITGAFADGEIYSLRKPLYTFSNMNYGALSANTMFSPRVGQQMIGLGLLENVPETTLSSFADENDVDGDGVSGRMNYVYDPISKQTKAGRFGWKANVSNLYHQSAAAFNGDIGITTWLFQEQNCTSVELDCQNAISGGTYELDSTNLNKVVLYARTLGVPMRRNYTDETVLVGKGLFKKIGCESCHKSKMQTGDASQIAALNNVTIRPYTDLLLHDMGAGLADNRPDFLANGNEWRTQPLWGLGLCKTVSGHTYMLHDGRARNSTEAILWHGGEAEKSKTAFTQLTKEKRDAVIKFLESL